MVCLRYIPMLLNKKKKGKKENPYAKARLPSCSHFGIVPVSIEEDSLFPPALFQNGLSLITFINLFCEIGNI